MRQGIRIELGALRAWARLAKAGRPSRLGLVVGRRHGNAIRRNRIKRLIREAFRRVRDEFPASLDMAISPRPGAALRLGALRGQLLELARRADRRLRRTTPATDNEAS